MGQWQALRFATTSASPARPSMIARWRAVFPAVPLLNLYGTTECSSNVTAYNTDDYTPDHLRVPIGKPLGNTRVYVLDKQMKLVPIGVTGEMCVAGACVAKGYLNLPQRTSECFGPDPFSDDDLLPEDPVSDDDLVPEDLSSSSSSSSSSSCPLHLCHRHHRLVVMPSSKSNTKLRHTTCL